MRIAVEGLFNMSVLHRCDGLGEECLPGRYGGDILHTTRAFRRNICMLRLAQMLTVDDAINLVYVDRV